jgi:hypothetical protein
MASANSVCGVYFGRKMVRPDRRDELSPTERKELERAKPNVELVLRPDGTFVREITAGTWRQTGNRIELTPTSFGGETVEVMRERSESMGRTFALSFLFNPFELRFEGGALVSADDRLLIYMEFRREWPVESGQ